VNTPEVKQNLKLGSFVLGGLILFVVSVFFIGKESNIFNKTFVISAIFKNVEGLQKGDNVWLSGVKIGTVKSVDIFIEGKVVVNLSLRDKQNKFIRKDATASIGSDGFIGNKIVVIRPGTSKQMIDHGDTINSLSPTDTQDIINIAKEVGENTKSITTDLKAIVAKINRGEGLAGELLTEGPMTKDVRATVTSLKFTAQNASKASLELTGLLDEMKNGKGLLPTVISDTTFAKTFEQAMGNVKLVSQNAAIVAGNLEKVSAKMNNTDNAVGVLLADTASANKLKQTLRNTESASEKLNENMEALKHNFLFRGYFRRQAKKEKKEKDEAAKSSSH
jgi:phospholipid/cholesterol/gamma-HCH transport system substrate-binding protein